MGTFFQHSIMFALFAVLASTVKVTSDEKLNTVIRKNFMTRDADGDGILTLDELHTYFEKRKISPGQMLIVDKAFASMDHDHTGKVTFDEYRAVVLHTLSESTTIIQILENLFHSHENSANETVLP